jgi:hypothetical protein
MIRRRIVTFFALFALGIVPLGRAAFAHAGQEHIMGTVKNIDDRSITVATKGKPEVTISLDPSTKFEKAGKAVSAKDVPSGARVVVHAKRVGDGLRAVLVKVGSRKNSERHRDHGK